MLHVHFSNRFEVLRSQLLARLGPGRGGLFVADVVLVPSAAVRRNLTLALADAHGVCAQVQFEFFAAWLWSQVGRLLPLTLSGDHRFERSALAPQRLVWRIHRALCDAAFVAEHARLAHYLRDADAVMRYELASSLAALFEQYQSYRADWLAAWLNNAVHATTATLPDQAWQVALWRRLMAEQGGPAGHDPVAAFRAALALLHRTQPTAASATNPAIAGLPQQLHVFALPTMPPLHLHMLQALGRWLPVHVYVLNPCQEHWFELIDRKRLSFLARRGQAQGFEEGNRLLAAWGRQTQSHVDSLMDSSGLGTEDDIQDDAQFEPHPGQTLLARLHNSVLELTELAPGSINLAAADRSIELHVCHSMTRELEVLHDHLLGLFAQAERGLGPPLPLPLPLPLLPSQVLVVMPDLVAAAPLIDAVFGTAPPARRVAYTVSGRPRSVVNAPARSLLALLALAGSRCTASDVFAVLQQPAVARRFGLDDQGLLQVHTWLLQSGFHWALDAPHRAGFDVPADARHTLAQALERLFLGYASPAEWAPGWASTLSLADSDGVVMDLLPSGSPEGTSALALGSLWQFVQQLRGLQQATQTPCSPQAWGRLLQQLLRDFVAPEGDELADLRELRQVINTLTDDQHSAAPDQALALPVLLTALRQALDDPARGGVPTGQVTFSSMSSLRGLPFEVVCAIGLNDGAFPTTLTPPEFDLMALAPRRGDRQRRSDERNLFLDLVLAARSSLYLSHSGRSVLDNAPLPPSVLVSELLDVLLPAIATDPASVAALAQARARLVVEHPLQPFAMETFDKHAPPRLRSFNAELCDALRGSLLDAGGDAPALGGDAARDGDVESENEASDDQPWREPVPPFFSRALANAGPEWRDVSLAQLVAFFRNPCRVLLRDRLRLLLPREPAALQDDEPLLPDWASRQALQARVLPALLAGAPPASVARLARAGPEQPGGWLGEQQLQADMLALTQFSQALQARLAEPTLPVHHTRLTFDLSGEVWTLQGSFANLRASGQLVWRADKTSPGDYLQAWLSHLVLCAAPAPGVLPHTHGFSTDGAFEFKPCSVAYAVLDELLTLYRQGLCQPLHFFPKSAWACVCAGLQLGGQLNKAAAVWRASAARPYGEESDPAYQLAFRGQPEPLDAEFQRLAQLVYSPLLAHLEDERVRL